MRGGTSEKEVIDKSVVLERRCFRVGAIRETDLREYSITEEAFWRCGDTKRGIREEAFQRGGVLVRGNQRESVSERG